DRQHPRDLFDVKLLYENEGFTDALFRTFLVYVASSPRPVQELIKPNLSPLDKPFVQEFAGMTTIPVTIEDLAAARDRLLADIDSRMDDTAREFLIALHDGEPDFEAIGLPLAANLPAIRWKLLNLKKLIAENPDKHAEQKAELLEKLSR
ncbi:nucleotidyl transferase AbiEii/AbiGii toxin family protein, partial [Mesorhizobium sp. ORS 3428]